LTIVEVDDGFAFFASVCLGSFCFNPFGAGRLPSFKFEVIRMESICGISDSELIPNSLATSDLKI
jgi:hypothetical protein